MNDERKHAIKEAIRESLNPMPASVPEQEENEEDDPDDKTKDESNNQTTASIGRPTINLFTSFQCKGKKVNSHLTQRVKRRLRSGMERCHC